MKKLEDLHVKIFADGADFDSIVKMSANPLVKGFTTNPSLMRKAGVTDYESYARRLLAAVKQHPISFEVFADDFDEMIVQGREIASWGPNGNVKVPVINTKGEFAGKVIDTLSKEGATLNITAIYTADQCRMVADAISPNTPAIISVFAGRTADTGVDPMPIMRACREILNSRPKAELLWASTREIFNIFQADEAGCDIITAPNDIINKLSNIGKDLTEVSRDTVAGFYKDATASGFTIVPKTR